MFEPDYRMIVDAALNRKPRRMPVYEHKINDTFMEKYNGKKFAALLNGNDSDVAEYFNQYCGFYKLMTYDTVSFEVCITSILPDSGAILGGRPGPIQSRKDFETYPWGELAGKYWKIADRRFSKLGRMLPPGMKAVGGAGNGVFEISEDLVGYEYLSYMQVDDPELLSEIYSKIGALMCAIWKEFLTKYGQHFCLCRFGDDLGFKTGLLPTAKMFYGNILPQYKKLISLIHEHGKPFLWHSCGNIFEIMEDMISAGINAKHSNEDQISPFERWIDLYGSRIGLFGGIDVNLLCTEEPDDVFRIAVEKAKLFRNRTKGFALGSGNSIPEYIPTQSYMAMIEAAKKVRMDEQDK
jgi:uroporphyrinogen decarboxylase